ncbi:MAG: CGNR zinc finger domain-containing protein [Actinobacteria bacterium]|nr:CGNR zinc finger domain-containing protein [Actinomycetota bacterium]
MVDVKKNAANLSLEGGELCLDFTNTVDWRNDNKRQKEWLNDFSDLILWSRHVGILEEKTAQALSLKAWQQPDKAKQLYKKAIELREILFHIFSSLAIERKTEDYNLSIFNHFLVEAMGKSCLVSLQDGFTWSFCQEPDSMDFILNPIIKSAADLLVSPDLKRLKICADDCCGWLFIDMSRNNSRRWCNMKDCGNRAKAYRYYHRKCQEKKE